MSSTVLLRHLPIYYETKRYIPIHTLSRLLHTDDSQHIEGAKIITSKLAIQSVKFAPDVI